MGHGHGRKKSRYDLRQDIKHAKGQYRRKVESYYTGSDARCVWQGLQTIMDCKRKRSRELPSDAELPNKLNAFYARFVEYNTVPCVRAPVFRMTVISLSMTDVRKTG